MNNFNWMPNFTIAILLIVVVAILLTALLTWRLIPFLQKLKAGQMIREEGPESHQAKSGTPTMGGLAIIVGTIIVYLIWQPWGTETIVLLTTFVAFGALGFFDDYMKVKKKRNLGLTAIQKLVLQIVIAVAIAWYQSQMSASGTEINIPFTSLNLDFGVLYIPFVAFVIVAMVNSVNLTDGLDGLASGVTAIVALFFALGGVTVASMTGASVYPAFFCAALAGACLGFLVFNKNPAKVFMGDTGSLALGGGLAAAAVLLDMELMLPIVGGIYVIEALSVIIQVASFKLRGKRVFRMSPIHHHFELGGWSERKVVTVFWIVTFILCIIGFFGIR